jgi:hypothetical protein
MGRDCFVVLPAQDFLAMTIELGVFKRGVAPLYFKRVVGGNR